MSKENKEAASGTYAHKLPDHYHGPLSLEESERMTGNEMRIYYGLEPIDDPAMDEIRVTLDEAEFDTSENPR